MHVRHDYRGVTLSDSPSVDINGRAVVMPAQPKAGKQAKSQSRRFWAKPLEHHSAVKREYLIDSWLDMSNLE